MGRGKDKTVSVNDLRNMSPREQSALLGAARLGRVKVRGTAVVRDAAGNVRYDEPKRAGTYGENNIG